MQAGTIIRPTTVHAGTIIRPTTVHAGTIIQPATRHMEMLYGPRFPAEAIIEGKSRRGFKEMIPLKKALDVVCRRGAGAGEGGL